MPAQGVSARSTESISSQMVSTVPASGNTMYGETLLGHNEFVRSDPCQVFRPKGADSNMLTSIEHKEILETINKIERDVLNWSEDINHLKIRKESRTLKGWIAIAIITVIVSTSLFVFIKL